MSEDLQAALTAEPDNPEAKALLHQRSVTVEKVYLRHLDLYTLINGRLSSSRLFLPRKNDYRWKFGVKLHYSSLDMI